VGQTLTEKLKKRLGRNDGLSILREIYQGTIWITVVCFEATTFIEAGSISYDSSSSSSDDESA